MIRTGKDRTFWLAIAAILLAVPVLILHALPILAGRGDPHNGYPVLLYVHVVSGLPALFLGAAALLLRPRGAASLRHRWIGRAYLLTGSVNAVAGLGISIAAPHEPHSLYVATGASAVTWMVATAMGYRAIRNRRIEAHREWMNRSYILTWSFAGCRLAQAVTVWPSLGPEGLTAAVWLNWIIPLIVAQIALDWRKSGSLNQPSNP